MQSHKLLFILIIIFFLEACTNEKKENQTISTLPIQERKIVEKAIVYDYDTMEWSDIRLLDSTIILDLKYATADNFVQEKLYNCGRCFLRPAVAKLIVSAHQQLQQKELGLKLFDCYRPKHIQELLWEKVPNANYVTPPWKGSMHNRGAAIDLTIVDKHGQELSMGTPYDFFGETAHHTFTDHSPTVAANRKLLKDLMATFGLRPIRTEWWHYSYQKERYEISEMQWNCE